VKEGAERAMELRMREDELSGQRKEIARIDGQVDALAKRAGGISHASTKLESERLELKKTLNALEIGLEEARRLHDLDRKSKVP
jgi:hypothetical protein